MRRSGGQEKRGSSSLWAFICEGVYLPASPKKGKRKKGCAPKIYKTSVRFALLLYYCCRKAVRLTRKIRLKSSDMGDTQAKSGLDRTANVIVRLVADTRIKSVGISGLDGRFAFLRLLMRDDELTIAISYIQKTAQIWERELVSKRFLVVYGSGPYQYVEVDFKRANFAHLLGIRPTKERIKGTNLKREINATRFFELAKDGQLTKGNFVLTKDSYLREKIIPLYLAANLFSRKQSIGPFLPNSREKVDGLFGIGSKGQALVLGNHLNSPARPMFPKSFMSCDIDKIAFPLYQIKAVFSRPIFVKWFYPYQKEDRIAVFAGFDENLLDFDKVR